MLTSPCRTFTVNRSSKSAHPHTLSSARLKKESYFAQMLLREALISLRLTGLCSMTLPMIPMIISTELAEQGVALKEVAAL